MDDDEMCIFLASVFMVGYFFLVLNEKKRVLRRWWVRPTNRLRFEQGDHDNFLRELRQKDPVKYRSYMRMSVKSFDKLLALVSPKITKTYCARKPIDPSIKLEIAIR